MSRQIAIDGPAASGKSTVARKVAASLGACYVNTGEMYRTLTWVVRQRGIDPHGDPAPIVALLDTIDIVYQPDKTGQLILTLNGQPVDRRSIRAPRVTSAVSVVSAIPQVRTWMVARQQASAKAGDVVMEGRDIGTVVLPHATHKFFVTASPMERARRRLAQEGESADGATLESVAAEIAERDHIDSTRPISPLRPADDAVILDTTDLTIDQAVEQVLAIIQPSS